MTADLGRPIRQLTETRPISVAAIMQRADVQRHRRKPTVLKASVALASLAVLAGVLVVVTRNAGAPAQRVRMVQSPAPLRCSLVDTRTAAGAGVPVVRSSAIVFAPAASHLAGGQKVTVGLDTTNDGVALSIGRNPAGPHGASYQIDQYSGDDALGGSSTVTFRTMRAGDPIQVEIAIRNTDPTVEGSSGLSSIAYRLVDLRTHQSVQSGAAAMLRGTPASPIKEAIASHRDISVTEATWGSGWDAVNVGLGDEAISQPPAEDGGPLVGVTHKATAVVLVDAAHPKGLAVGIATLHAQVGDPVTLQAGTAIAGTHTAIAITDQRSGACVMSPG